MSNIANQMPLTVALEKKHDQRGAQQHDYGDYIGNEPDTVFYLAEYDNPKARAKFKEIGRVAPWQRHPRLIATEGMQQMTTVQAYLDGSTMPRADDGSEVSALPVDEPRREVLVVTEVPTDEDLTQVRQHVKHSPNSMAVLVPTADYEVGQAYESIGMRVWYSEADMEDGLPKMAGC